MTPHPEHHDITQPIIPEDERQADNPAPAPDEVTVTTEMRMTLEHLIDLTGEFAHLNELVMLHINNNGGFDTHDQYFSIVQPVLDKLESEIRIRCQPGMDAASMKCIVKEWIDTEIAALNRDSTG